MQAERRSFLKLLALGGGLAALGKFLPSLNAATNTNKTYSAFKKFKIEEQKNKLVFLNQNGKEVFSINENGEMEIGGKI